MKAPKQNPHLIRKENHSHLRIAQRVDSLNVAVTQSSALQSEIGLPAIRAIWSVIDDDNSNTAETDRRRKR